MHTVDWKKHQFVSHKVLVDASGWFQNHTHHWTNLYKNKLVVVLVINTLRYEGLQEHAPALPAPCSPSAHSSAVACYTSGPRHSLKNWFSRSWGLVQVSWGWLNLLMLSFSNKLISNKNVCPFFTKPGRVWRFHLKVVGPSTWESINLFSWCAMTANFNVLFTLSTNSCW